MSTFEGTPILEEGVSVDDAFDRIIQAEFDPAFTSNGVVIETAGSELVATSDQASEKPFGFFIVGDVEDPRRAAMASATGYTGNCSEESN